MPPPAPDRADPADTLRFTAAPDRPVPFQAYGDHFVVARTNDLPALADGSAEEVEVGGERVTVSVRVARGGERAKLRRWRLAHPVLGPQLLAAEQVARTGPDGDTDGGLPFVVLSRTDTYASKRRLNTAVIDEFRVNGGTVTRRVGDFSFAGVPLLLLHHRGRRTGRDLVNPLQYRLTEAGFVVFATNGGSPWHPDWYRNLRAAPATVVEIGTAAGAVGTVPVFARDLVGEDRERHLNGGTAPERLSRTERFGGYQAFIDREVPVVELARTTAPSPATDHHAHPHD